MKNDFLGRTSQENLTKPVELAAFRCAETTAECKREIKLRFFQLRKKTASKYNFAFWYIEAAVS